jgi:hypothetical protein
MSRVQFGILEHGVKETRANIDAGVWQEVFIDVETIEGLPCVNFVGYKLCSDKKADEYREFKRLNEIFGGDKVKQCELKHPSLTPPSTSKLPSPVYAKTLEGLYEQHQMLKDIVIKVELYLLKLFEGADITKEVFTEDGHDLVITFHPNMTFARASEIFKTFKEWWFPVRNALLCSNISVDVEIGQCCPSGCSSQ